jgi:D-alanyl-D-alanine carboxypeptidase
MRPNPVRSVQIGKNAEVDNNDEDHARPQLTAGEPMQIAPIPVRPSTPVALAPNGKRVTFATPPAATNTASAGAQNSPEVRAAYVSNAPFRALRPANAGAGDPPTTLNAQAQSLALNEPPLQSGAFVKDAEQYQPPKQEAPKQVASLDNEATASISRGPWKIQIGAFGSEEEAKEKLGDARGQASSILGRAKAFTEKTYKGATQLFRARFAGLDEAGARRACETLKKNDVECFATRN